MEVNIIIYFIQFSFKYFIDVCRIRDYLNCYLSYHDLYDLLLNNFKDLVKKHYKQVYEYSTFWATYFYTN
jgi:hypothetical protein